MTEAKKPDPDIDIVELIETGIHPVFLLLALVGGAVLAFVILARMHHEDTGDG